jgi:hypothetical protein
MVISKMVAKMAAVTLHLAYFLTNLLQTSRVGAILCIIW